MDAAIATAQAYANLTRSPCRLVWRESHDKRSGWLEFWSVSDYPDGRTTHTVTILHRE